VKPLPPPSTLVPVPLTDTMHRLLNAVGAGKEADELETQKSELMRVKFDEQARHERRKTQATLRFEAGSSPTGSSLHDLRRVV
ncbi:MAG TPA: hypothetical protein PLG26_14190, partial [Verrucomicrobiota bacterium]|nr:hypothetical protein [Verrucomicrobiota bacterium]HOG88397.1 hypothetical protein [Verrucomicrobiota bacterium]HPV12039.1 hypothetical protein [Verrucomicrobiota bacterium]HQA42468.1 hypothetical protein [Verrucomicrobiota bacterium]